MFAFCLAFGSLGLDRASAQLTALVPTPFPSLGAGPSATGANPTGTKVVRIYNGAGYFDDALAEKLRPRLAKAFPSSGPEAGQAVPGAAGAAPVKPENQKKVAVAAAHP